MNKQLNNEELLNIIAEQVTDTSKIQKTLEKILLLQSEKLKELQDDVIYIKKGRGQSGTNKETTTITEDAILNKVDTSTKAIQLTFNNHFERIYMLFSNNVNAIQAQSKNIEVKVSALYDKEKMQKVILLISILLLISLGGNIYQRRMYRQQRAQFEMESTDSKKYIYFHKFIMRKEPKLIEKYIKLYNENPAEINAETDALEK